MADLHDRFTQLFTHVTQAHHDADLILQIGKQILDENPETMQKMSQEIVDVLVDGMKEKMDTDISEMLANIPGGAVNFQVERNNDIFIYGLVTHNIVMHHSIFDGLLGDLIQWIAEVNPSLFDGAIKDRKIAVGDVTGGGFEDAKKQITQKYVKEILRESVSKKVTAITAAITGPVPDLNSGYIYDGDFMEDVDLRRHDIIHDISKRVRIDDGLKISNYMRQSSIAFTYHVFGKLHETMAKPDVTDAPDNLGILPS